MKFMNLRKSMVLGMLAAMSISMSVANAANEMNIPQERKHFCGEYAAMNVICPRADKIVIKYRKHNNVFQYRRWNETKGCWVDPDWIDM